MLRPNYQRVADDLRNQITSGVLGPGDKLPSIRQLQAKYGVGNNAVHMAIVILKSEGLVYGHQGKGVFVSEPE
ncbi:winged helix-turn-helix domain-containing protein [Plantactinospora sp. B5E13]|uniref:winged helix-turn-helix domain-containing protein n=1 Tax=Plantactinospora sp. B5E13 TaxID=3153758 RepID=UPI00325D936B